MLNGNPLRKLYARPIRYAAVEQVRQEGDAVGGAGGRELEDLRDLDDGGGGDDAEAQALGDGELEAFLVGGVDVDEERLVAWPAEEGDAELPDGGREVVGYGLEGRAEGRPFSGVMRMRGGGLRSVLARNAWSMRGWVVMWFDVSSREGELDAEQLPNVAKIDQLSESAFRGTPWMCTRYQMSATAPEKGAATHRHRPTCKSFVHNNPGDLI